MNSHSLQYLVDNFPTKPKEVEILSRDAKIMKAAREELIEKQNKPKSKWGRAFDSRVKRKRGATVNGKRLRPNVGI